MNIQSLHTGFIMPTMATEGSGAFDVYMPVDGYTNGAPRLYGLGFAAEVPKNHVALLVPRSSTGAKYGLELNNTVGVIDSDYRGEWKAMLRTKDAGIFQWKAGDRILQFMIIPVNTQITLNQVEKLEDSTRNLGGFGSSGA